jgi:hypothetical protein
MAIRSLNDLFFSLPTLSFIAHRSSRMSISIFRIPVPPPSYYTYADLTPSFVSHRQQHGFQELRPDTSMSEMLGTVLKAILRCYQLYTLVQLLHLRLRFNLKIKHPPPTPFTSVQPSPPPTPPMYLRLSIPSPFPTRPLRIKSQLSSPTYPIYSFIISTPHVYAPRATIREHGGQTGGPAYGGRCVMCLGSGVVQFFTYKVVCGVCGGVGRVF